MKHVIHLLHKTRPYLTATFVKMPYTAQLILQ